MKASITRAQRRILDYVAISGSTEGSAGLAGATGRVVVTPQALGIRRRNLERAIRGLYRRAVPLIGYTLTIDDGYFVWLSQAGLARVSDKAQAMIRLGCSQAPSLDLYTGGTFSRASLRSF